MGWQKELGVMNNGGEMKDEGRSRRGEAIGDQCPKEIKNQKEMKNLAVCYDTSESAVMIDFYRIRGVFPL